MLRSDTLFTLVLTAVLSACAASRQPVPVVGTAPDIHALAGEWVGEYSSAMSGRSGSIVFTLRAADDSAFGDVVMVPARWGRPVAPWRQPGGPPAAQGTPETAVLTIRFVRIQQGVVSGTLDPYADPGTGARLVTTFVGELAGNTITGTYTTRLPSGETQTGSWTVQRR